MAATEKTPEPGIAANLPDDTIDVEFLSLPHKPDAKIAYTLVKAESSHRILVCVNGLGMPQEGWFSAIDLLLDEWDPPSRSGRREPHRLPCSIVTYDRYGAGATKDKDPDDAKAEDPKYGHDLRESVNDLYVFLLEISKKVQQDYTGDVELLLIGNSIGCSIIRMLCNRIQEESAASSSSGCQLKPTGIIFLDSMIANTDFVSIFPDPDALDWEETQKHALDLDCDEETYRMVREGVRRSFHPNNTNPEGLDRRNLAELLPTSDTPKFGDSIKQLLVVGHDPDTFAEFSLSAAGMPKSLTRKFLQPTWHEYNQGLLRLVDGRNRVTQEPIFAKGCGHVIQNDGPKLVAGYIRDIVNNLGWV